MSARYQIFKSESPLDSQQVSAFLSKEGQLLLPMVDLVEQAQCAVDEVIDVMGRATIEAILQMSAEQHAGPKQQGKSTDRNVVYHGKRSGRVALKERQLRVQTPRLRKRNKSRGESAEVDVPAYQAMQKEGRLADRMLEIMMVGVSTRKYEEVLPEMAEQVGISKNQVSREFIEAGQRMLQSLAGKDLSELGILVVYIDGIQFGKYHVICAMGVDSGGHKHVLGLREGATENAEVAIALLEDLAGRGLDAFTRRLFVIDGFKTLRKAINQVFGDDQPVQRCRNHKLRNVLGHLPKEQHDQAKSTIKAAWKLDAADGEAKLKQYASWLEPDWPDAAGSLRTRGVFVIEVGSNVSMQISGKVIRTINQRLREGLSEMFTINRFGLPSSLRRCLGTINVIDNGHSATRYSESRTGRTV